MGLSSACGSAMHVNEQFLDVQQGKRPNRFVLFYLVICSMRFMDGRPARYLLDTVKVTVITHFYYSLRKSNSHQGPVLHCVPR